MDALAAGQPDIDRGGLRGLADERLGLVGVIEAVVRRELAVAVADHALDVLDELDPPRHTSERAREQRSHRGVATHAIEVAVRVDDVPHMCRVEVDIRAT
ncbi:MAG: hypothetical protein R3C32_02605 [Chloroflexota bacterium]